MNFVIITHVKHIRESNTLFAYEPYVREMNLWLKHVNKVTIVAPESTESKSVIESHYIHDNLNFKPIMSINFTSIKSAVFAIVKMPLILNTIFKACRKADHIHLRCPGNIGLLGCLVQIFFPKKIKTAKYAGNWDPDDVQPISYKFQKWLLSNTFLTKNMTTLVYGDWKNQTKNIKPFFTATYKNDDRQIPKVRNYLGNLNFVFVGSLVEGKRPLLAIQIVEKLISIGYGVNLDLYGDGFLKEDLQAYINENDLGLKVKLLGNHKKQVVKEALEKAHFLILPSKSEGWPKAIAEAMFFGTIPIATSISCVPYMLDYGKRGILIEPNFEEASNKISTYLSNEAKLKEMAELSSKWSQNYTLDIFETEIAKLLKY